LQDDELEFLADGGGFAEFEVRGRDAVQAVVEG